MRNKRKWKSLTHKVEHLRLEIEDRDEVIKEYEVEFLKNLSESIEGSLPDQNVDEQQETSVQVNYSKFDHPEAAAEDLPSANENAESLPEDIKKLWKSIAVMTHPDRTKNDPHKTELYLAAAKAVETGSIDEIVRIAIELGIELPEASTAAVTKLETIASDLQKKISETESSMLWQWGNASLEVKQRIMDAYIAMKKYKKKESSQV